MVESTIDKHGIIHILTPASTVYCGIKNTQSTGKMNILSINCKTCLSKIPGKSLGIDYRGRALKILHITTNPEGLEIAIVKQGAITITTRLVKISPQDPNIKYITISKKHYKI